MKSISEIVKMPLSNKSPLSTRDFWISWFPLLLLALIIIPFHRSFANDTLNYKNQHLIEYSEQVISSIKQDFPLVTGVAKEYERVVYTALSFYPELKNTQIIFSTAETKWPLTAQPVFSDVLNPFRRRCYRVIISEKSSKNLEAVLLKNIPFNAQIGAIGHELGHIVDYQSKSGVQLMALGMLYWTGFSRTKVEQRADRNAVEHALGYQLYEWSSYVRNVMGDNDWVIPNQTFKKTYSSPDNILSMIKESPLYR